MAHPESYLFLPNGSKNARTQAHTNFLILTNSHSIMTLSSLSYMRVPFQHWGKQGTNSS